MFYFEWAHCKVCTLKPMNMVWWGVFLVWKKVFEDLWDFLGLLEKVNLNKYGTVGLEKEWASNEALSIKELPSKKYWIFFLFCS